MIKFYYNILYIIIKLIILLIIIFSILKLSVYNPDTSKETPDGP